MCIVLFFFFNDTATTEIYTLSLHDALPICALSVLFLVVSAIMKLVRPQAIVDGFTHLGLPEKLTLPLGILELGCTIIYRSEEHTSELQSPCNLVCRLLLEKKKQTHRHLSRYIIQTIHFNIMINIIHLYDLCYTPHYLDLILVSSCYYTSISLHLLYKQSHH